MPATSYPSLVSCRSRSFATAISLSTIRIFRLVAVSGLMTKKSSQIPRGAYRRCDLTPPINALT